MFDPRALRLFQETLSHLDHPLRLVLRHRALARRIRRYLDDKEADLPRPAAIRRARDRARLVPGISIDADETVLRATIDGIEVRAWFFVPHGALSDEDADHIAQVAGRLQALPPLTCEIFQLHRAEGLCFADVAARLGISERTVRRHMFRAITHLVRQRGRSA